MAKGSGGGGRKIGANTSADQVTLFRNNRTVEGRVVNGQFEAGSLDWRGRFMPSISNFRTSVMGSKLEQLSDSGGIIPGYVIRG